jgi:hypothetical protein
VRNANDRFAESSERVLGLERQGADAASMQLHLQEEHPVSHEIEGAMTALVNNAVQAADDARAMLESDQCLLTRLVLGFSAVSLLTALLLGFALSTASSST